MAAAPGTQTTPIYQLKITLLHIRPPIWRRIQARGDISLGQVHRLIQAAMGWGDFHLHCFRIGGLEYSQPDPAGLIDFMDERRLKLTHFAEGGKFRYEYDFGDGWEHEILVEKILAPEEGVRYPICLKGRRATPPEDSGGPHAYPYFLNALRDPDHAEHVMWLDWVGGQFDPERFDLEATTERLRQM